MQKVLIINMNFLQGKQLQQNLEMDGTVVYGTYIPGELQAMSSNYYPLNPASAEQIKELVSYLMPDKIYCFNSALIDTITVVLGSENLYKKIELVMNNI